MADARTLDFYYAPHTRSSVTLGLLEELGAPYELHVLNFRAAETRAPAYLAINPMGKVPAIRHNGALITEQVAIHLYLADEFPQARLAPPIGDPLRGPYLRWLIFYAACFEPAVADRAQQRDAGNPSACPYGDFETMFATVCGQLSAGPYLFGDRFTAADVLWGQALWWAGVFKMVPERPEVVAYAKQVTERPALVRAAAKDAELAAGQTVPT
jgi:glutathione S-transferase